MIDVNEQLNHYFKNHCNKMHVSLVIFIYCTRRTCLLGWEELDKSQGET